MKPRYFFTVPLLAFALVGSSGLETDGKTPPPADPSLESYMPLIAEFDLRRRVNVLFPNPQTLFDGLQAGFVNVGSGNLTFLRRDMVTRANGPLVFGRVYDSRREEDGDFGPGWRLSLAEELHIGDARVAYVDGSGARRLFVPGPVGYRPMRPTPRHSGTRIALGEDEATVREDDGTRRTFKPVGDDGPWRVVSVKTNARRVDYRYRDGKLDSVVHGTRRMFQMQRDGAGRIVGVRDDHGRSVRFSYTAAGQLKDVYDIAGNLWWHEYDAVGRLTAAIGGNQEPYLQVRYDGQGRVRESRTGREYTFTYEADRTVVADGSGQRHVFERNRAGTTVAFSSTSGVRWSVWLNANNRVKRLTLPSRTLDYDYDASGRITMVDDSTRGRQEYVYDGHGRLVSVKSLHGEEMLAADYGTRSVRLAEGGGIANGIPFSYDLTPSGRIAAVWNRNVRFDAEYDSSGDLTTLRHNGYSVRFERDSLGRITATTYPSGHRNRYSRDLLGNRQLAQYDSGASVAYRHDAAGNIVGVEVMERDGTAARQTTTVGAMNRVERIAYNPGRTLDVDYDGMGRPTEFDDGVQRVVVEYGAHGTVRRLSVPATGERLAWSGRPPPGVRALAVRRLAVLSGDALGRPHPDYGPVRFAETTFHALPLDAAETGVPDLASARDLFAVALPLYGGTFEWIVEHFEKPSNPAFQPAEYRSTNCCIDFYGPPSCGPEDPAWGSGEIASFLATVEQVDQCMRAADAEIRGVTPHRVRYDPPRPEGWLDRERGATTKCNGGYCTHLNYEEIRKDIAEARAVSITARAIIHDVLAHEYAHHIRNSPIEGGNHERLAGRLRYRTNACD